MISKHLTILPAVAALLLSAGCSNDDMDGALADGPVAAQVTATISNGQAATRASITDNVATFEDGDVINVVASETDTYEYSLSGGTWSAVSSPYYFQDLNTVSFRGWYATTTPTDNSISIDTSTQTTNEDGWNEWDILAAPEVTATTASPTINFTGDNAFTHVMSQVTLTFKAGNGVDNLTALTGYTLKDLTTDADFNTLTCELTTGSTTGDITQDIEASGTEYTCTPVILVPQEVTDGKLSLEVSYNGQTYVTDLVLPESATAMAAGTHYAFNVNVNNTGLTVNSAAIADWTATDTESGSASIPITEGYTFTTDDNGIRTYTVYSESGLLAWSEYTRSGHWATNCTLANDVTLTAVTTDGGSNWTAVGTSSNRYTGTFDGNGYTIGNLKIEASSNDQGLIGCLGSGGEVKNLTMASVSISDNNHYGIGAVAVVGVNYYGTVTNCCYASGTVSGRSETGGVVGTNYYGTVTACYSTGEVNGSESVGGVVGYNYGGTVTACYSMGSVSGSDETGGVVGNNMRGTVTACYSTATVSGEHDTGGVVGNNMMGTVTACYWNNGATNGIGYDDDSESGSDDNATKVDGTNVTWATTALKAMNEALSNGGYSWEYVENEDENEPLKLASTAAE